MNRNKISKALPRLIFVTFIISLVGISESASPVAGDDGDLVNQSVNGKPSTRHTKRASGDYDSYGSHIDYFEPSPIDDSGDESSQPLPATADCPPICGNDGADDSYPPYQPTAEDESGSHSDEDQSEEYEPENHDLEGNVMWTSN